MSEITNQAKVPIPDFVLQIGKAGLSQAVRRTPEARSCTNAVRKRAALTAMRTSAEPGTKRGRLGWWVSRFRKDCDG
jgi:hypothetical protein